MWRGLVKHHGIQSLPKTLTLFMTKICDFPYPIYDLTKNLIPYLHV